MNRQSVFHFPATPRHLLERSLDFLSLVGRLFVFILQVCNLLIRPPFYLREILDATARVGVRCLVPVLFTVGPFGMIFALHGAEVMGVFSAQRLLGFMVGIATLRELAPNLTGVIVAAQAGSAFAAELAAMQSQEEIDATRMMGVNPMKFHVIPRILGITLASPLLMLLGATAGIVGGYVMTVVLDGQNGGAYVDNLFGALSLFDLWSGLLKTTVFGAIIGVLGCFLGFTAGRTLQAVGNAVNNTVVYSITLFMVMNYFLSTALFGIVD